MARKPASESSFPLRILDPMASVPACIVGEGPSCEPGKKLGIILFPRLSTGYLYSVGPDGIKAKALKASSDVPVMPEEIAKAQEVVAETKRLLSQSVSPMSPSVKGRWTAAMVCTPKGPQVILMRSIGGGTKVAVASIPDGGWEYAVDRGDHWTGKGKQVLGEKGFPKMAKAIDAAFSAGLGVISETCAARVAHRKPGETGETKTLKSETAAHKKAVAKAAEVAEQKGRAGKRIGKKATREVAKETRAAVKAAVKEKKVAERKAAAAKRKEERKAASVGEKSERKAATAAKRADRAAARKAETAAKRAKAKAAREAAKLAARKPPKAVKEAVDKFFRVKSGPDKDAEVKILGYEAGKKRGTWFLTYKLPSGEAGKTLKKDMRKMKGAPKKPKAAAKPKTPRVAKPKTAAKPKAAAKRASTGSLSAQADAAARALLSQAVLTEAALDF